MILFGILALYGATQGGVDVQATLSSMTAAWPTITRSGGCSFGAGGPVGNCGLLDTVYIGAIWVFAAFGSALYRIVLGGFLIYQLGTGFAVVLGVPIAGPVVLGFQILLGLYGYSMFRGNHPNLG